MGRKKSSAQERCGKGEEKRRIVDGQDEYR
jgi:hypothetical protein